ncbi:MAG: hypothetical protein ACOXZZ_06250 [Sphaerochaetaceae bacterium]
MKRGLLIVALSLILSFKLFSYSFVDSDYFKIVFNENQEQSASEVLSFADDVLLSLSSLFNYMPKEKITIYLSGNPVDANGYFISLYPKLVLYTTPPASQQSGLTTGSWLKTLLTHELSHYLHLTQPVGIAKILKPIFGPGAASVNSFLMPLWWIEGVTTYNENSRGLNESWKLRYKVPFYENKMWSLAKGSYHSPVYPFDRGYITGYLMVSHLIENYGFDTFNEINRLFTTFPLFGISGPFKKVIDKSAKELYTEAIKESTTNFVIDEKESTILSKADEGDYYLPFITNNGIIGLVRSYNKGGMIYNYTEERVIAKRLPLFELNQFDLVDDSLYFTYSNYSFSSFKSLGVDMVSYSDLYSYNLETGKSKKLTNKERLKQIAVSEDHAIVFATQGDKLIKLDLNTQEKEVVYQSDKGSLHDVKVDGKKVVFVELKEKLSSLIIVENGKTNSLIKNSPNLILDPQFVDNQTIWFVSDKEDKLQLYSYSLIEDKIFKVVGSPTPILSATKDHSFLIYTTYSPSGIIVRQLTLENLEFEETAFEENALSSSVKHPPLNSKKFIDLPKFSFWLPISIDDSEDFPLGATLFFQSLLEQHTIVVSSGYRLKAKEFFARLSYDFNKGPFVTNISANVDFDETFKFKEFSLGGQLNYITIDITTLKANHLVVSSVGALLTKKPTYTHYSILGRVLYQLSSPVSPYNRLGRYRLLTSALAQYENTFDETYQRLVAVLNLYGQVPLATSQIVSLDLEGVLVKLPNQDLLGEFLTTFKYSWQLSKFDQPIPLGGLTGLKLSLYAQKRLYYLNKGFVWDDDLTLGAILSTDIVLGASSEITLFGKVAYSIATDDFKFNLGIELGNLLFDNLHTFK